VGCKKSDPRVEPDRQVFITFTSKSLSLLKSLATEDEDRIKKIIIFGVDDQNNVDKSFVIDNPSLSNGIVLTISRKIKTFYAIANPSTSLEVASPLTVSDLIALTDDFSNLPESPFLMSGIANIINETATIELTRVVAKIKIISTGGFQINSIIVENTSSKGYVFPRLPFSTPSEKTNYTELLSSEPTFYVAENSSVSPTRFVVSGQLDGKPSKYTIQQLTTSTGNPINIVRNCYYEVTIKPITEDDCSITINIVDWIDVEVGGHTIPDNAFE